MSLADTWDVVIAGAGPAGSTTAYLLAKEGFRVALLDRAHFPRPKSCAEYLSPGVTESLRRLGLGNVISPEVTCPVAGMEIVSPSGKALRLEYQSDEGRLWASTMRRDEFDHALLRAAEAAGASTFLGWRAKEPIVEEGIVRGFRGTAAGKAIDARARISIIADGNRSSLTRALGLSRSVGWPLRLGLVARFAGTPRLRDDFGQMHVEHDGYCGIAPLPDGQVNVSVVTSMDAVRRAEISASQWFDRWIARSPALRQTLTGCERVEPVRGVGPIGSRTRRAWCPGALVVGDAASFFDPFTGEGIYRAVHGAELAARVVAESLCSPAASLATYERLRTAAFRRKELVTLLVQLFVQFPRLMEYSFPRLARRRTPMRTLGLVLGDVSDAGEFMRPPMLWAALRP